MILESKIKELWWMKRNLQYTATGYGKKIPTQYMVKHNNKWKRVYCSIFSNNGTYYIMNKGETLVVDSFQEIFEIKEK